jgi:hypothetical protein
MPKAPTQPALSIASGAAPVPEPPRPLGEHGRLLWNAIQREYGIQDVGGRELLGQICAAVDRAEALAAAIKTDGDVIYTRAGVPRSHPAIKDELGCRAFIVRAIEKLGISVESIKPVGRPVGRGGWTPDDGP